MAGEGFRNLEMRLQQLKDSAEPAAKEAAKAMATVGERGMKIELSRSSHPRGTRTPAAPGMPPSLVTGRMRAAVKQTKLYRSGVGQWTSHVASTVKYARIHELGGHAGPHHRVYIPPRPYVWPTQLRWAEKARDAAITTFKQISGL